MRQTLRLVLFWGFLSGVLASKSDREEKKILSSVPDDNTQEPNFAQDLVDTAKRVGHDLSIDDVKIAEEAETEQEVEESLPLPVAEKLIGHRRKNRLDLVREQMIGLVFTGEPRPLGSNRVPIRRRFETRPPKHRRPHPGAPGVFNPQNLNPDHILKPYPFVPHPSNVKFPVAPVTHSTRVRRPGPPGPPGPPRRPHLPPSHPPKRPPPNHFDEHTAHSHVEFKPPTGSKFRPERRPNRDPEGPPHHLSEDFFSNTVGPDFGPVTFETFGPKFPEGHFEEIGPLPPPRIPKKPQKEPPLRPFKSSNRVPASGFSTTQFGNFGDKKPFPPKPDLGGFEEDKDFHEGFGGGPSFGGGSSFVGGSSFGGGFNSKPNLGGPKQPSVTGGFPLPGTGGECSKYTENICLDADNYPHQDILASLVRDPSRADTLMAEVRDQSADDLVDGVTAAQESKYDFTHYFGNRRQDTVNHVHRDFAEDGGYLCPSEVKYARPKRARNSKGEWKFIVNMDKYTQTIRMEKCMKPGGTCSYVSHHYHATCSQIYNYQRLLSWEKKRGLHMDIFKVPSCCTCHIQGYAYVFPPLGGSDNKFAFSIRRDTIASPGNVNKLSPLDKSEASKPTSRGLPPGAREEDFKKTPEGSTTRRRNRKGSRRSDNHEHRVNYGYHPIIDFFNK